MTSPAPAPNASPLPFPVLIADIGGTNARFALVAENGAMQAFPAVHTGDHGSIEDGTATALRGAPPPRSAVLALAGPVKDGKVRLTNANWLIDPSALIARFALRTVILINDFEALAMALPALGGGDLLAVGEGLPSGTGVRVVVGPGTGLGAAALLPAGDFLVPVAGEGGHMDFGPRSARDRAIWPFLAEPGERVSGEMLISGPGLLRLYAAVCRSRSAEPSLASSPDISLAGMTGRDPLAAETLDLFVAYLGRYAGDLALLFMAKGGVYLAGGVTQALAPLIAGKRPMSDSLADNAPAGDGFRSAFADKAPHSALLAAMPSAIITHPVPALLGLAGYVRAGSPFRLNLAGRRWDG